MSTTRNRSTALHHMLLAGSAIVGACLVAACSVGSADSNADVTGTNDSCELATDQIDAGKVAFAFTNQADDVSELYVLRANGDVIGEVENVTTGTTRTLTVDLIAGEYQLRCKPGQAGDGITSSFDVTGEGGTQQAAPERTIEFDAVDFTYNDLDVTGVSSGDTIRFEMTNTGTQPHEFEVLNPDGDAVGEVAAVAAGESGGATITFEVPGTYTYQCILVDAASTEQHTMLGMTGTFKVAKG